MSALEKNKSVKRTIYSSKVCSVERVGHLLEQVDTENRRTNRWANEQSTDMVSACVSLPLNAGNRYKVYIIGQ